MAEFSPRGISIAARELARLKARRGRPMRDVACASSADVSVLSPQASSNVTRRCARTNHVHPSAIQAASVECVKVATELAGQDPANLEQTPAATMHLGERSTSRSMRQAGECSAALSPEELANTAWAFATWKFVHCPLLDAIASPSLQRIRDFSSQALANTAWAYAQLSLSHLPLMHAIASQARATLAAVCSSAAVVDGFDAEGLAIMLWSFARLRVADGPLFHAIAASSNPHIAEFSAPDLANMAWSFAKIVVVDAPFLAAISAQSMPTIAAAGFSAQAVADTAWAFARLSVLDAPFLDAIAAASVPKSEEFTPPMFADTAWAFAASEVRHIPLLQAISAGAQAKLAKFMPQELAAISWSFAAVRVRHGPLLNAISAAALPRMSPVAGAWRSSDLAGISWSFAQLRVTNTPLNAALAAAAEAHMAECSAQDLAAMSWAFSVWQCPGRLPCSAPDAATNAKGLEEEEVAATAPLSQVLGRSPVKDVDPEFWNLSGVEMFRRLLGEQDSAIGSETSAPPRSAAQEEDSALRPARVWLSRRSTPF
mmetsp:Transcript_159638/g.512256  ORF Transcript_159638/g.512256 Transcript_159638/m.512256 type:complete len:543 (+) Transcript_159638:9-1637(+)